MSRCENRRLTTAKVRWASAISDEIRKRGLVNKQTKFNQKPFQQESCSMVKFQHLHFVVELYNAMHGHYAATTTITMNAVL